MVITPPVLALIVMSEAVMPPIVPADTTLEAFHVQFQILRRLSPSRRLELACQLSDFVRGNCTQAFAPVILNTARSRFIWR